MFSFGVNKLTQLGAYGCTVGGKGTLQNAIVIGSQKFNSSPRMSSEISPVGDFESVDYLWDCAWKQKKSKTVKCTLKGKYHFEKLFFFSALYIMFDV